MFTAMSHSRSKPITVDVCTMHAPSPRGTIELCSQMLAAQHAFWSAAKKVSCRSKLQYVVCRLDG